MSFLYIHGERLMPFIVVMYALGMIIWAATIYGLITFWQRRKRKK
jgi:hypothetical protein